MRDTTTLDTRSLEHLIGYCLVRAGVPTMRVFRRQIGAPFDLRPVEFSLLLLLLDNPGASPKQLGLALAMSPPNVTVLVDRVVARGLAERRKSASDGRAQEVWLTESGTALARKTGEVSRTMEDGVLQVLTPAERALLRELLVKLAEAG